jgi:hypothetical protein
VRNPSLHQRAMGISAWLALSACGISGAACNDNHGVSLITTAPPVVAATTISPSLIGLTALGGFFCPGFVFSTSFNVIVVSSTQDLTMNHVTLQLLDGTTIGGPSVTIPSPRLNTLFGTTLVTAGTTRAFPFQPVFDCSATRPNALGAIVVLADGHGGQQTMRMTAPIR